MKCLRTVLPLVADGGAGMRPVQEHCILRGDTQFMLLRQSLASRSRTRTLTHLLSVTSVASQAAKTRLPRCDCNYDICKMQAYCRNVRKAIPKLAFHSIHHEKQGTSSGALVGLKFTPVRRCRRQSSAGWPSNCAELWSAHHGGVQGNHCVLILPG